MLTLLRERYEVLETLGSGGEARVVKALDRQHGRFVALKIRQVTGSARQKNLLAEARLLLAVPPHPALPLVREDFFEGDEYVVAMDWVEGTDLEKLLVERGRPGLAPSRVMAYLAEAAEALTHLHTQSPPVIHGDVKPANLILTKGGRVKLVDFGLSSAPDGVGGRRGTPGYEAPEVTAGGQPSRASDIYALAATAFALLTGVPPSTGDLPAVAGVDAARAKQLEDAIRLGLATDPASRPKTPGELIERLRAGWSEGLPSGVVTFCMSDIEGSTALWDTHPEEMAEALVRHDELIVDAVEAHGGSVVQTMGEGDSTVSVFDSAPRAVAAAVAANRAIAAERWPTGIAIAVRWGLHTGEVERRGTEFRGPTIIVAARLRAQADGGQVFLSSVTSELAAAHLPDGYELVDLGPHRLKGLGAPERIRALKGPGVNAPRPATDCPYRGLLSFEADDREFFFGREEVVADILGRLGPGRLLAVVGASGSGKSSVLRAGVLASVLSGSVTGLRTASLLTPGSQPELDVPDEPDRLVIVDQFEELFTACEDEDRRLAFIDALLGLRGAVAIGVRADLYGKLSTHIELARAVADNQVLLGAMTAAELERAITEPARLAGLKLEPGLVELVLRDVAAEPGALPLMSHALRATWERRDGRTLTVEGYRESGGVASAIAHTADSVVDALPDAQRHLARSVFLRMTELGEGIQDSRRRVTIDELVTDGASADAVHTLVGRLADARLVMLDEGSAEVAHEALIREWPRLRGWLDEDRAALGMHRQLSNAARLWEAGGREPSDLYRDARLAGAIELAQAGRVELNATERAFLDTSVAEADRERRAQLRSNRRLRALLSAAVVLLLVAVAAGVGALVQRNHAQAQSLTSDAERVGALALTAPTLDQSMLFAVAGVELRDNVQTRGDLLAVLQHNAAAVHVVPISAAGVAAFATSPDGRLLAAGDTLGVVRFVDLRTWRQAGPSVRLPQPVSEQGMAFAPDGRTLAVATRGDYNDQVYSIDVATRSARSLSAWSTLPSGPGTPTTSVAYSPDSHRLAVAEATFSPASRNLVDQRLVLLDASSGGVLWRRAYPFTPQQSAASVTFTPDGTLVTSAQQGQTLVWNARTGQVVRRYPIGGRSALSPDGHTFAVALNTVDISKAASAVGIIDLRTGHVGQLAAALPNEWILGLAFTRDGKEIAGAALEGTHVWDLASGRIVDTYPGPQRTGTNPGVVVGGAGLVLVVSGGGSVSAWDPQGSQRLGRMFFQTGCCPVFNRQGTLMATSQLDGTTTVYDLRTLRPSLTLPADDGPISSGLTFTPDGRQLLTGGIHHTVTVWDLATHSAVRRLHFPEPVWAMAISPDGSLLAVATQIPRRTDVHVHVLNLGSGRTLYTRTIGFQTNPLATFNPEEVAFVGGGSELVAQTCCSGGSTVVGWDARSGTTLFDRVPDQPVTALGAWPDSQLLVVGTQNGQAMVWDARTGAQQGPAIKVSATPVVQITLSPDGRLFAAAAHGTTTLWDIASHSQVGDSFPIGLGVIPQVAFEPTGPVMITELVDSIQWPVDRSTLQRFACQVAGRDMTPAEWKDLLPNRPYMHVCPGGG